MSTTAIGICFMVGAVILVALAIRRAEQWVDKQFKSDEEIWEDDRPLVRPSPPIQVRGDGRLGPVIRSGERVSSGDAGDNTVTPPLSPQCRRLG